MSYDTTTLKQIADALDHSARVAKALADKHAGLKEYEESGRQVEREKRNRAWGAELRKAIRTLEDAPVVPRKTAGDAPETINFIAFWDAYPIGRKAGKADARRAWRDMRCEQIWPAVIDGLNRARESFDWQKDAGQYIPHPATWLRREGWTDELFKPSEAQPTDPRREKEIPDPQRWKAFLAERKLPVRRFQFAPNHWRESFAQWERENGF